MNQIMKVAASLPGCALSSSLQASFSTLIPGPGYSSSSVTLPVSQPGLREETRSVFCYNDQNIQTCFCEISSL